MTNLEVVLLAKELAAGKRSIVAAAALAAAQLHAVLMTQGYKHVATARMHHLVKLANDKSACLQAITLAEELAAVEGGINAAAAVAAAHLEAVLMEQGFRDVAAARMHLDAANAALGLTVEVTGELFCCHM